MKIVNRKQFLALPSGVIYSQYETLGMVDGLLKKGDTWGNDWLYTDLLSEIDKKGSTDFNQAYEDAENGQEFRLGYDCICRDGAFEDEAMFMVYDNDDLNGLILKLVQSKHLPPSI